MENQQENQQPGSNEFYNRMSDKQKEEFHTAMFGLQSMLNKRFIENYLKDLKK